MDTFHEQLKEVINQIYSVTDKACMKYISDANKYAKKGIQWHLAEINDGQRMLDLTIQIPEFTYSKVIATIIDIGHYYDLIEGDGDTFTESTLCHFNHSRRTMTIRNQNGHETIDIRLVHILGGLDSIDCRLGYLQQLANNVTKSLWISAKPTTITPFPLIDITSDEPPVHKILEVCTKHVKTAWPWSVVGTGYIDDLYVDESIKSARRIVEFNIPPDYGRGTIGAIICTDYIKPYVRGSLKPEVTVGMVTGKVKFLQIRKGMQTVNLNLTIIEIIQTLDEIEDDVCDINHESISDPFALLAL